MYQRYLSSQSIVEAFLNNRIDIGTIELINLVWSLTLSWRVCNHDVPVTQLGCSRRQGRLTVSRSGEGHHSI